MSIYNVYLLRTTEQRIQVEADDSDQAVAETARLFQAGMIIPTETRIVQERIRSYRTPEETA